MVVIWTAPGIILQPRQCTAVGNNSDFGRDSDRPANWMARDSHLLSISISKFDHL